MKNPELDLSQPNCHVCGQPLFRDIKGQIEWCINHFCKIRSINFSIPYVVEKNHEGI